MCALSSVLAGPGPFRVTSWGSVGGRGGEEKWDKREKKKIMTNEEKNGLL